MATASGFSHIGMFVVWTEGARDTQQDRCRLWVQVAAARANDELRLIVHLVNASQMKRCLDRSNVSVRREV